MPSNESVPRNLSFYPVTGDRWPDLERLFGPRGACAGCWCMWWLLPRRDFDRQKGEANRLAMKARIESGEIPGLLAYDGVDPVGWCAVGPREAYPSLERSRVLQRVDDEPVWSIVCFFVSKSHRRQGLTLGLIQAAVAYAAGHGATTVEAYPVEPKQANMPDIFAYTGMISAFRRAGFIDVARRSPTRPIMRYRIPASATPLPGAIL